MLVKAGGQEGTKKKKTRFFTLGNEMIAYFDCKDMKGATMKKLKGTFPITPESTVEMRGLVKGSDEHLPSPNFDDAYAFEITSAGRTFSLYAATEVNGNSFAWLASAHHADSFLRKLAALTSVAHLQVEQRKWTKGVMTMIDYLSKRGSAAGAFSEQIGRFAAACVGINQVLGDAVDITTQNAKAYVESMSDELTTSSAEIMSNLVDNKNRMDVLVSRTRESIKGYDVVMKKKYDESAVRLVLQASFITTSLYISCSVPGCSWTPQSALRWHLSWRKTSPSSPRPVRRLMMRKQRQQRLLQVSMLCSAD